MKRTNLIKMATGALATFAMVATMGAFTNVSAAIPDTLYVSADKDGIYNMANEEQTIPGMTFKDGILKLNNCTFKTSTTNRALVIAGDVTIDVTGTNTISNEEYVSSTSFRNDVTAIRFDDSAKITGSGTLNIKSGDYKGGDAYESTALDVSKDLIIDMTGTINATSGESDLRSSGIYAQTFTLNNGTVNASGKADNITEFYDGMSIPEVSAGLIFSDTCTINKGTFNAEGCSAIFSSGVYSNDGSMTVNDGKVTVTATHCALINAAISVGFTPEDSGNQTLYIKGGTIYAKAKVGPDFSTYKSSAASVFAKTINCGLNTYTKDSDRYYCVAGKFGSSTLKADFWQINVNGATTFDATGKTPTLDVMISAKPEEKPVQPTTTKAPTVKKALSIKSAKVKGKNKINIKWVKKTGYKSYQIFIATNKQMTKHKYKFIVKKGTSKTFTYKALKKNGKGSPVFIKMRTAKKSKGKYKYGKWTKAYRIKTK